MQNVGFQRIEGRHQFAHEGEQPIEVGLGQGRIAPPIFVVARLQSSDPGLNEIRLI